MTTTTEKTMKKLFTLLTAGLMCLGLSSAYAADEMTKKDEMSKDAMGKDMMKKPAKKDEMKKDEMMKDEMKKDGMGMGKDQMTK